MNPTGYPQVFDEVTNGVVTRTYTYGVQRISEYQPIDNVWTPSFYGYDGFGTVRQLTNPAGAVTDTYEYDAFGNEITHTGTTTNNYLYRGEQFDSDIGLYYLRARYYNPATGRFMSRDPDDGGPRDPKTLHKYLYTGGDPVNGWDPTGRAEAATYSLLSRRDFALTFAKAVVVSGITDCLLEYTLSKFTDAIDIAWNGGSITQTGPCVWIVVNLAKALPKAEAPPQPVPGTKVSPWTPQCDELRDAKNAAKATAQALGICKEGMHPTQLQIRYDAWLALGAARQAYNKACWSGGDEAHQDAADVAWDNAEDCAELKESF